MSGASGSYYLHTKYTIVANSRLRNLCCLCFSGSERLEIGLLNRRRRRSCELCGLFVYKHFRFNITMKQINNKSFKFDCFSSNNLSP